MKKVIVYSTPTCSYCMLAKDYFKDNKVEYTEIDVSQNQDAAKKI